MIVDTLIKKIIETQNPTCVGLDTSFSYLPESLQRGCADPVRAAAAVTVFNREVIDAVADIVPAVKVQIAYYEALGTPGLIAFRSTLEYAAKKGLIVIADVKRNDIGATAAQYAKAYFQGAFRCDFATVNPYLGSDGVLPFLEDAEAYDKGLFLLVKTSNPSSGELQDLKLGDGRAVYEAVADMVSAFGADSLGEYGYSRAGAVVGATYPEEAAALRERMPHAFFLVPGYGAQGAGAANLKGCFHAGGMGGIVNNSRGILLAYRKRGGSFAEAARQAVIEMREDLLAALGAIHA